MNDATPSPDLAAAPAGVREALRRALRAMQSVTVFVTSKERIKRPEGEEWWQDEIAALSNAADERSFPEVSDGRGFSDTAVELFGAGCDPEAARFVARQLERKGLVLTPTPAAETAPDAGLVEALKQAAYTFRTYEQMHAEKGTQDGILKAMTNAEHARRCEDAVAAALSRAGERT